MISPEKHIEALVKDCERVASDIRQLEAMVDKFIGFGITIVSAGFAYGVSSRITEIFFILPVAMFGIYYVFIERMRTIVWLGAYKRALEDKINLLAETLVFDWEMLVQEHRGRGDVIVWSVNVVYAIALVAVTGFSVYRINDASLAGQYKWWVVPSYIAFIVILILLLFLCGHRWLTAYKPAYEQSRRSLGLNDPKIQNLKSNDGFAPVLPR
jgi:hypothetical protein